MRLRQHLSLRHGGLCCLLALVLSGCGGSGDKFEEFKPNRVLVLGDEISYLGCQRTDDPSPGSSASALVPVPNDNIPCVGHNNNDRFTANDTSNNNWVLQLASLFGLQLEQVVEPNYVDASKTSASSTPAKQRRDSRLAAKAGAIQGMLNYLPSHQTGDLLIIAGGTHDILCALRGDASGCPSTLSRPGLDASALIASVAGADSLGTDKATRIIAAAQNYQNLALDTIRNRGHRHVFLVPVSDFGQSPSFTAASSTEITRATKLFNTSLQTLTDTDGVPITFRNGNPRILLYPGQDYVTLASSPTDFATVDEGSGKLYLTPSRYVQVGTIFYNFMRSSQGW